MVSVKEKIQDVDLIVDDIKIQPQTYNTILKNEVFNTTCQFVLRKKLNRLLKQGIIFKTTIPGTRFGQVILYIEPKEYNIVVENDRIGINVYYFFNYEKLGRYRIKVNKYWVLDNTEWIEKQEELILFEGKILKFI